MDDEFPSISHSFSVCIVCWAVILKPLCHGPSTQPIIRQYSELYSWCGNLSKILGLFGQNKHKPKIMGKSKKKKKFLW